MREQARVIATQHSYWKRHGEQIRPKNPLNFERWVLHGIRRAEKKGIEFEFLAPGLIQIITLGKPNMLRTLADLEREYQNEYFSHF